MWIGILVLAGIAEAIYAARLPLPEVAVLVPDDSYFYLQVAQRFVEHGTFAFGPGTETYGFQPLWQLIVIGLAYLTPDRAALLYGTLLLCVAIRTLTGIALYRLGRTMWGPSAGVFASTVWAFNPAIALWSWGLKENTLYALFLVLAAQALVVLLRHGASWRHAAWFGVWLGLALVTRVNAALVVAVLGLTALLASGQETRARRLPRVVAAGALALAVAGPWYAFAYVHFGSAMPTSGTWKLMIGQSHVENVWQMGWWSLAHAHRGLLETGTYLRRTLANGFGPIEFALAGAAAATLMTRPLAALRRPRAGRGSGTWWVFAALVLAAGAGAWLTAMTLSPYLAYAKWYTVPEYVVLALGFGFVLGRAFTACRHLLGRVVAATALVLALLVWPADRWRAHGPWLGHTMPHDLLARAPAETQTLELGLWAARHVPEGVTLGMLDPGVITYFSGRNVVSLDPLMNSLAYQRGMLDGASHPVRYCLERDISHVVGSGFVEDGKWVFRGLPPSTYDVLWVPFPDFPLPWGGGQPVYSMIVRLRATQAPEFVVPSALPCGLYRPNEAQEARVMEAAARPESLSGDALRLRVAAGAGGAWSLVSDGREVATAAVDAAGWAFFDLRPLRGLRPNLRFNGEATLPQLLEAYSVDFTFPTAP